MTDFNNFSVMNKKELLALAGEMQIKGRHEMTKDQLVESLIERTVALYGDKADVQRVASKITPHYAPTQIDDDKLAEIGVQIIDQAQKKVKAWVNKSGNVPWRKKPYMIDEYIFAAAVEAGDVAKAPNQVQLILRGMIEMGFTDPARARIGKDIIDALKQAGKLNTTIPSASLFAYYRRAMEELGVVHCNSMMVAVANGYDPTVGGADVDEEEGEE